MCSSLFIIAAAWLSQESLPNAAEARAAADFAQDVVEGYQFILGTDEPLEIQSEPVLRWTNQLNRRFYGDVFLWTRNGRPEVIASVTNVFGADHRSETEIHSLSLGRPVLTVDGTELWGPEEPGITYQSIPDASQPSANASARLRQMRRLAGRFSATSETNGQSQSLRLLPTPLYRYEQKSSAIDGGLFAFVNGTDPEVFLIIESHSESAPHWVYALARFNGHCRIAVQFDDEDAWIVEQLPADKIRDARSVYFAHRNQVP